MNPWLKDASAGLTIETQAVANVAARLTADPCALICAVGRIDPSKTVLLTGVGKSGHTAQAIAALLTSTGIRSVYLDPLQAEHGDLGLAQAGDAVIFVSASGATPELWALIPPLRRRGCYPLIGILGDLRSSLARAMDLRLDASVECEADPLGLLPTASSLAALLVGHALVIGLMASRGFTREQYAAVHPAGAIGRRLCRTLPKEL